jgi:hypothetical protein
MNLEQCREKLEREAKHATAGIFGGRSWSANFWGCLGVLLRRSGLRERVRKRGGCGRWQGFFFLETGRWREAVQIMVDEHRNAQIDNRGDL